MLAKLIIIVLFLFCSFVSTSSFANLKEINQLNKLLKKGYEKHFVPYVDRKSSSNIFTCVVHKFQYQ